MRCHHPTTKHQLWSMPAITAVPTLPLLHASLPARQLRCNSLLLLHNPTHFEAKGLLSCRPAPQLLPTTLNFTPCSSSRCSRLLPLNSVPTVNTPPRPPTLSSRACRSCSSVAAHCTSMTEVKR